MKKNKKPISIVMATALITTSLAVAPQALAVDDVSVEALDSNGVDEDSDYEITFTLEEDLDSGEEIIITFDDDFQISKSISKSNVKVEGKAPKSVSFDSKNNEITIKVNTSYDEGDDIEVVISDVITNPDTKGEYRVDVETENETSDYAKVSIGSKSSSSSKDFSVELDSTKAGEKTAIELGDFDLKGSDKLKTGNVITVIFPDADMLPRSLDEADVKVNGYVAKDVSIDDDEVEIEVPSGANNKDYINLEFLKAGGIKNPSNGDYTFKIKYEGVTYQSEKFSIKGTGSSSSSTASSFTVSLSDPTAGARTSYSFEADFGNKQLNPDDQFTIEFPSADMIPGIISAEDFTINGKTAKRVGATGSKVYVTTPSNFSKSSTVKVNIGFGAWISNPKAAGTYNLKMTVDGRTATSKDFTVSGATVNPAPVTPTSPTAPTTPQTGTPAAVNNNSTATIALGTTAMGAATGLTVSIKNMGAALTKQRDFIELVFPAGYTVPAYIAPANITVNGAAANFVAVRGQNVLVYPAQDLPASGAATVVISAGANIINPKVKNTYSISVFTSEEKGLLFARAVGVGMPAPALPAQPAPAPAPATPAAPAAQPSAAVPANAALFKLNTNSYTLHGKTHQLQVAPYLANGNTTMVPAQFFKEGLALTTQWNNQTVAIISGTKVLRFTVGSNKAKIGNEEHTLTAPVALKDGMPMIPVRFVTDNLGYKVGWDAQTSSVYVYR